MSAQPGFSLSFTHESLACHANELVLTYGFCLDQQTMPRLNLTLERLELLIEGFKPLFVDFNDVKWIRRSQAKQQGLMKACQPQAGVRIIDATAGWGRDAAILVHAGADVLMLERHPLMAALLQDGLNRFYPAHRAGSLTLQCTNAMDYLRNLERAHYPDVIYMDPMHPERQKSALVKKEMQALQCLIGPDFDALDLLQVAQPRAHKRVVVKWPQYAPSLIKPLHSILGKTVRFDVFSGHVEHFLSV